MFLVKRHFWESGPYTIYGLRNTAIQPIIMDRNVNITEVYQRPMKICNLPLLGIEPGTSRLKDECASV